MSEIMNTNQSTATNAELQLEASILSRLFFVFCDIKCGNIDDDKLAIVAENISKLSQGIETNSKNKYLDSSGIKTKVSYFSHSFYEDIFNFLSTSFTASKYPDPWEVKKYLQHQIKYKNIQNTIAASINQIIDIDREDPILATYTLTELTDRLISSTRKREASKELSSAVQNGVSSESDIESLKAIIDNLDVVSPKDQLELGIKKFTESKSAVERVLAKKSLRMLGYTPNEVSDLTDNYVAPRPAPVLISAKTFLETKFQDATWIYPGLIKAGVVNLVTGQGGSGKSLFCLDVMLSYLDGRPFLGEEPSVLSYRSSKRGLLINADQPDVDVQEMLRSNPLAWKHRDNFDIIGGGWSLADFPHLEMLLAEGTHDFVIIDSYKAIHSHLSDWDENKPSASAGLKELTKLCDKYGTTMVVIHHAGNAQEKGRHASRGHSSIADTASAVMTIKAASNEDGKGDPNVRFLEISKTRNAERSKITLKFNPLTYSYDVLPDTAGIEREKISNLTKTMFMEFTMKFPDKISDEMLLSKIMGGNKKELLGKVLQKLEQRGLIFREMDEKDGKFFYNLTPPGIAMKFKSTPKVVSLREKLHPELTIQERERESEVLPDNVIKLPIKNRELVGKTNAGELEGFDDF